MTLARNSKAPKFSPPPPLRAVPTPRLSQSRESIESIESLRAYYHSVHDAERADVIELLGSMKEPDAARELIGLYAECQWRSTRLQIIRALSQNPTQRSLEFLFQLAQEPKDIPIAEAAIWSLGQTHHTLAARFLVHFYRGCGEVLKPSIVGALGQIPDRTLAREFLEELPRALKSHQTSLVKNLVLTLGELKVKEALPLLMTLAADRNLPTVSLSALVAIGKIAREPKAIEGLERKYQDDLFEYQLFTSVKTQIQFRSQWGLEDYLSRIFETEGFHRTLPFELNHFKSEDVREGLKLFAGPQYLERLCLALGKVDFAGDAEWYGELIDFSKLDRDGVQRVLESLACHLDARIEDPLKALGAHPSVASGENLQSWLAAVSMALPEAEQTFRDFFASEQYRNLPKGAQIESINHLINYGLSVQTNGARLQSVGRILESLLESGSGEDNPTVQARALRGIGHLRFASKKALCFARDGLKEPELVSSCLQFLENAPEKSAATALLEVLDPKLVSPTWLKCLAAQLALPETHAGLDAFIRAGLAGKAKLETRIESLRVLGRHPRKAFLKEIVSALKDDDRVALAAVIALRGYGAWVREIRELEGTQDGVEITLATLLHSKQQSLVGRALDTLTAIPSLRAKRIVVDFLKERAEDADICDKIARCLEAPETGHDYFIAIVDGILKLNPQHPKLDGLLQLREKFAAGSAASSASRLQSVKGADIAAIDRDLTSRIAGYEEFDEQTKSALRSAELPFKYPEMFDEWVDKSSSLVEYCKAVDLFLERTLGKKHLFPKLESQLHEFQSALHAAGVGEDFPSADRVIRQMGLEKHFNAQSLPLHKMLTVAQGIRSGRIVNERFKTLDGLRAWAVMLLLFGRKIQGNKPLIPIKNATDDQIAGLCKRLNALQEIRNPAAHRQTVIDLALIDETRSEVFALINQLQKMW